MHSCRASFFRLEPFSWETEHWRPMAEPNRDLGSSSRGNRNRRRADGNANSGHANGSTNSDYANGYTNGGRVNGSMNGVHASGGRANGQHSNGQGSNIARRAPIRQNIIHDPARAPLDAQVCLRSWSCIKHHDTNTQYLTHIQYRFKMPRKETTSSRSADYAIRHSSIPTCQRFSK